MISKPLAENLAGGLASVALDGGAELAPPEAISYIAAVTAAQGSAPTSSQQNAIIAFITAEMAAGRWVSHKRIYLPIWANAAANAIDMKTLAVATFPAGATHGVGFVQGDGTTQYMQDAATPAELGIIATSGYLCAMPITAEANADTRSMLGARTSSSGDGEISMYQNNANQISGIVARSATGVEVAYFNPTPRVGIYMVNRNPTGLSIANRTSSGIVRGSLAGGDTTPTITAIQVLNYMALRDGTFTTLFSTSRFGAFAAGLGLADDAAVDAFTLNLKTLWEASTGLTLPVSDPVAAAYIAAVETAKGSPVTAVQQTAINNFIVAEKAAGRWTAMKRLYLPIWSNANANRIDMITLATGTWSGGITHGAGYVKGVSSGYLNMNATPATLGLTATAGGMGFLNLGDDTGSSNVYMMGTQNSITQSLTFFWATVPETRMTWLDTTAGSINRAGAVTGLNGILTAQRFGGVRYMNRRTNSGQSSLNSVTSGNSGTLPTLNIFAMCYNNNGTASTFSIGRYGAFFICTGWDATADAAFTLNLKTCWMALTGLSLP